MKSEQLIVSVLVANQPGALIRVTSLFAKRGINISSLHVEQLENPETSRIVLVADGGVEEQDLITRQLEKIYDVKEVELAEAGSAIARKGLFLKQDAEAFEKTKTSHMLESLSKGTLLVEVTGNSKNLNAFVDYLRPYGMIELVGGRQTN
jgi:acetolactate synthase I/III small subunit